MREIVIDTETTGLDPHAGHRIVEIACIELMHHVPTSRPPFHRYVNPERDMPPEAYAVHGLTEEFLAAHPPFSTIVADFLDFIGDDRLVIHNAEFDLAFINAELARLDRKPLAGAFVDTLAVARRRFPGAPASLDALCRRFNIDLATRELHGAHIDCGLLASVYIELLGGRQPGLNFAMSGSIDMMGIAGQLAPSRPPRPPRPHMPTAEELAAHQAMLATAIKSPLWLAAA
ncbi:MAG TPA: DNA polymerase III subunit epsilon [Stellaceae bacterium]|nr:DNA polymerase III subunit epsilon [Stellaceae bacterium]